MHYLRLTERLKTGHIWLNGFVHLEMLQCQDVELGMAILTSGLLYKRGELLSRDLLVGTNVVGIHCGEDDHLVYWDVPSAGSFSEQSLRSKVETQNA